MGKKFPEIEEKQIKFINEQHIYFVGSATADSSINISPKGLDSLRVLDKNRVIWLNLTGSGNETAAHMQSHNRMTMMFCSFDEKAKILRLYGHAKTVFPGDETWDELYSHFDPLPGARQIFDMHVELVHTSCGFGVPLYDFVGERPMLNEWAERKKESGIADYWQKRNSVSMDGEPIHFPTSDV
ncbi:MAG: pyridoxamine 5'-phosphate oxidase family protein [Mariprofundus sp.]|nr:pyridoxamine 5'-phosphate oxidase family protein [Mariprofundus sp.]